MQCGGLRIRTSAGRVIRAAGATVRASRVGQSNRRVHPAQRPCTHRPLAQAPPRLQCPPWPSCLVNSWKQVWQWLARGAKRPRRRPGMRRAPSREEVRAANQEVQAPSDRAHRGLHADQPPGSHRSTGHQARLNSRASHGRHRSVKAQTPLKLQTMGVQGDPASTVVATCVRRCPTVRCGACVVERRCPTDRCGACVEERGP